MKALFLVLHRKDRSPGQRYRHEQYIEMLQKKGFSCYFSPLLSEKHDRVFYGSGKFIFKMWIGLACLAKRIRDVNRASQFDIIYIYRDAFFFGSFIERMLSKKKPKLIYDFDDAIWLKDLNPKQGIFNLLKNPRKIEKIISYCDQVVAGNEYLMKYAFKFNSNVQIIPSTIDFSKYGQVEKANKSKICIGWTGSFSTIKHFEGVVPALIKVKAKYGDLVYFKLIGEPNYKNEELDLVGTEWRSATEAQDLAELSIGLMPLPNDEWSRGKCAMKGLQYMALEIPTIMSPVGVNKEIIQDGENGFLATTEEEWIEKLSSLIEDERLRIQVGKAGKRTVVDSFSVEANKEKWLAVLRS